MPEKKKIHYSFNGYIPCNPRDRTNQSENRDEVTCKMCMKSFDDIDNGFVTPKDRQAARMRKIYHQNKNYKKRVSKEKKAELAKEKALEEYRAKFYREKKFDRMPIRRCLSGCGRPAFATEDKRIISEFCERCI